MLLLDRPPSVATCIPFADLIEIFADHTDEALRDIEQKERSFSQLDLWLSCLFLTRLPYAPRWRVKSTADSCNIVFSSASIKLHTQTRAMP